MYACAGHTDRGYRGKAVLGHPAALLALAHSTPGAAVVILEQDNITCMHAQCRSSMHVPSYNQGLRRFLMQANLGLS